jgi:hypothetical protein
MSNRYYLFDKELIDLLGLKDTFEINQNYSSIPLRDYTTFKSLNVDDINNLRLLLFLNKKISNIWSEKILKYIEIWLSQFNRRLNLNYQSQKDRMLFKQYIISFLLEFCYYSNDLRFLNTAIKISNSSNILEPKQCIYNNSLVEFLINKI